MNSQKKIRVHQDSLECELNSVVKRSAIAALFKKFEQTLDIFLRYGFAPGEPRYSRNDFRSACSLFFWRLRPADKQRATAWSVLCWSCCVIWTTDLYGVYL